MTYGDGEAIRGRLGYQDVTLAGITVKKQQIALIDQVYSGGDGVTSGLLGLAYPLLTGAFVGTNAADRKPGSPGQHEYDPVFTSIYKQGLVSPIFSMSMNRNNSGWLTLGGLPPVDYAPDFASTPIRMVSIR